MQITHQFFRIIHPTSAKLTIHVTFSPFNYFGMQYGERENMTHYKLFIAERGGISDWATLKCNPELSESIWVPVCLVGV